MEREAEVDALVVGAGPGGSTAAWHLARRGLSVLLVDRSTFPREKVCGDGLTPRAVAVMERMGVDPGGPGFFPVEGCRVVGTGGRSVEFVWPGARSFPALGLVRRRLDFDHLLARRASDAGADVREGVEALRPLVRDGRVAGAVLREADGEEQVVRSRFVVASDGAAGRFAARAGVERDPRGPVAVAARRYFRSPRPQDAMFEAYLTLRDGDRWLPGYGWVFPMGDGELNVGAYVVRGAADGDGPRVSARRAFDAFVATLPDGWGLVEERATGPLGSAAIPMAVTRRRVAVPGLLLVGDAAGLANPFTGEGIGYAMESAEVAAELIGRAAARSDPDLLRAYPALLRQRYGALFGAGRRFARAVSHPAVMRFGATAGMRVRPVARFALEAMAHVGDGRAGGVRDRLEDGLFRMAALGEPVPARSGARR